MNPLPISEFEPRVPAMLGLLKRMVEIESPTGDKAALDTLGELVAHEMSGRGARVRREAQPSAGDHWVGTWGSSPGGALLLTHLDTVYPRGTLSRTPWRETDDRILGPGVLDMKGGVTLALTVLGALRDLGRLPSRRVTLLCTSDEETGSHSSRSLIEKLAREHEVVFCLEPGLPDGSVKTWRKGIGDFELEVTGRAAHAGANPEAGVNAVVEMAAQIDRLLLIAETDPGTTVNPAVIVGGTVSNVIPDSCRLSVDIRVTDPLAQEKAQRQLDRLAPIHPGARLQVRGEWNRPPMPRSAAIAVTYERAREIGRTLGLTVTEGGSGGGSDANFVAPLGKGLLDGLGPVGNHAHSEREYIVRASLPTRAALLAACLTEW